MKVPRIEVTEENDGTYSLTWWDEEYQEPGGYIGDAEYSPAILRKAVKRAEKTGEYDYVECVLATQAAWNAPGVLREDYREPRWETRTGALKARGMVKVALKAYHKKWPDWTKDALAAGWKPPKGWEP